MSLLHLRAAVAYDIVVNHRASAAGRDECGVPITALYLGPFALWLSPEPLKHDRPRVSRANLVPLPGFEPGFPP